MHFNFSEEHKADGPDSHSKTNKRKFLFQPQPTFVKCVKNEALEGLEKNLHLHEVKYEL
jgi:hypothetical protein